MKEPVAAKVYNLGLELRKMREAQGISQEQLAWLTGLRQQNISSWELGNRIPSYKTLVIYLDGIDAPDEFILRIMKKGNINEGKMANIF